MIPFSPPRVDEKTAEAVKEVLLSGWITTGPKTKQFEKELAHYCGAKRVICLNSATAGLETMLRWYGVGPGDEVIVPAYTYAATANVVLHCGATPVMVDIDENDFTISVDAARKAITPKTKVIMPVDIGGLPANYSALVSLVNEPDIKSQFKPSQESQQKLGRIMILTDAAHSVGARYKGKIVGSQTDVMVFSFHAVKNLTTAEGGAVALNLPAPFDNEEIYKSLCIHTLHGQTKDALSKTAGSWRYDIIEAGYKCNMTDLQAVIGLIELSRYESETLPVRKKIFQQYQEAFSKENWAHCPVYTDADRESCAHLFMLRVKKASEQQRDKIIERIAEKGVSVNVHFLPLPMLTVYKSKGYDIKHFPKTFAAYQNEISLPIYYTLTNEQVQTVIKAVKESVKEVMG
ncbi:MAG: DegT/DnrJ/EryC1/StrS family aminotransferase [Flavobacteriales bacterium]